MDSDAAAYIAAVESADGSTLPGLISSAIDALVVGLKSDSVWTQITNAFLFVGPARVNGALVPLKGSSPTIGSSVPYDYLRTSGLSNAVSGNTFQLPVSWNAFSQNDHHLSAWINTVTATATALQLLGPNSFVAGVSEIVVVKTPNTVNVRNQTSSSATARAFTAPGFAGGSRSASGSYTVRANGTSYTESIASQTPAATPVSAFRSGGTFAAAGCRLGWVSVGSALDLSLLEARVSTYMTAVSAFAVAYRPSSPFSSQVIG
jgi:hypothetical protein